MTTPNDFIELARERRGSLLRELAVIDKFIEDYGPAVAEGLPFIVPADTPDPPAPKPGAITILRGMDLGFYPTEEKLGEPVRRGTPETTSGEPVREAKLEPRAWTAEDDERLLEYRKLKFTVPVIADDLGRTPASVTARIAKLKAGVEASKKWTADEDDLLQLFYVEKRETMAIIAGKLGRTKHAIRHHLSKLGLRRDFTLKPGPKKGSKSKEKAPAPKKTARPPTIAELYAETARRKKRREPDPVRKPLGEPSRMNAWTDEQDKVLKREWNRGRMSNYMLAKKIGKPAPETTRRARELKLGTRARTKKNRKCLLTECDTRFVPEDWKKEWYCEKHRTLIKHKGTIGMPQDPGRSFRESARS